MALVATIGGADSNSYLTLDNVLAADGTTVIATGANEYFAESLHATAWTSASEPDKGKALVSATRFIDAKFRFKGIKTDQDQALAFPRYGVTNLDGYAYDNDELPKRLKDATAELALSLLAGGISAFSDPSTGIRKVKAGAVEVEFDKEDRVETITDDVSALLSHLVENELNSGFRQVPLFRT